MAPVLSPVAAGTAAGVVPNPSSSLAAPDSHPHHRQGGSTHFLVLDAHPEAPWSSAGPDPQGEGVFFMPTVPVSFVHSALVDQIIAPALLSVDCVPSNEQGFWKTKTKGFSKKRYPCCRLVNKSCLTLCDPRDCSLPGFSVHGILQARILEWVAISFSRGSSQLRDWTHLLLGRRILHQWATWEAYSVSLAVIKIIIQKWP